MPYIFVMPYEAGISITSYRWREWGSETLSNMPKVTQLVNGKARIQIQVSDNEGYAPN